MSNLWNYSWFSYKIAPLSLRHLMVNEAGRGDSGMVSVKALFLPLCYSISTQAICLAAIAHSSPTLMTLVWVLLTSHCSKRERSQPLLPPVAPETQPPKDSLLSIPPGQPLCQQDIGHQPEWHQPQLWPYTKVPWCDTGQKSHVFPPHQSCCIQDWSQNPPLEQTCWHSMGCLLHHPVHLCTGPGILQHWICCSSFVSQHPYQVNVVLNSAMRRVSGTLTSTPVECLQVCSLRHRTCWASPKLSHDGSRRKCSDLMFSLVPEPVDPASLRLPRKHFSTEGHRLASS